MSKWKCSSCEYFEYDEYWNGEEELCVFNCEKGNQDHIGWNTEPCEDFMKAGFDHGTS